MEEGINRRKNPDLRTALSQEGISVVRAPNRTFGYASFDWQGDINERNQEILERATQTLIESCQRYTSAVLMKDSFGNDQDSRRAWRNKMAAEYGASFESLDKHNKIRGNLLMNVLSYVQALIDIAEVFHVRSRQIEQLKPLMADIPEDLGDVYSSMSEQQKIQVVEKTERIAESVLRIFGVLEQNATN